MAGDALRVIANLSIPVFVVSSMLSMGLALRVAQILQAGANHRFVLGVFLANFLVVPALALALNALIPLDPALGAGLLILAAGSGAPLLPKLAQAARGNLALATGLMVMLMTATVLFLPVVLPLLVGPGVQARRWDLARPLIFYMLLPLALGLLARRWLPGPAAALWPVTNGIANLALVVAVALLIALNAGGLARALGSGAVLTGLLFETGAFLAGYALAGRNPGNRLVAGLATAQRDVSAALLLATGNFASRPDVSVMILLVGLVGLAGLLAAAAAYRARDGTVAEPAAGQD